MPFIRYQTSNDEVVFINASHITNVVMTSALLRVYITGRAEPYEFEMGTDSADKCYKALDLDNAKSIGKRVAPPRLA